jgi:hypothetical protein
MAPVSKDGGGLMLRDAALRAAPQHEAEEGARRVAALVMAGHSASEDARERAFDPAIHLLRKKASYEERWTNRTRVYPSSGILSAQVG